MMRGKSRNMAMAPVMGFRSLALRSCGLVALATLLASSPADARRQGIGTVYQEFNLVPTLSVAENLALGDFQRRWFGIDLWRRIGLPRNRELRRWLHRCLRQLQCKLQRGRKRIDS